MAADETARTFPTYAALTQTQGWSRAAVGPIVAELAPTQQMAIPEPLRYAQGELLGRGGMGTVMLARDERIGREVAIKELHAERELSSEDRARFLREARVQGQLEHPSIVPVYDIDQRPDGTTFFTMRRVLGRTLEAIVDDLRRGDPTAQTRYTQRELLTAFATVCLAIDYAHSRGVVHRDLKPANIMLGDFGEVYVLDWGLALLRDETIKRSIEEPATRLSMTGELLGTPLYMAPEQMSDPQVGTAADVFALGAILFEILTLERLRDATTLYLPADARPSVRAPSRDVAPELEAICVRATETEPGDRYPSARAVHEALASYLEGDRDMQRRRELAAAHAAAAREALMRAEQDDAQSEQQRAIASSELVKALGLDPTSPKHASAFAQLLATPPRVLPTAVAEDLSASEQLVVRSAAKLSAASMLMWLACVPLVLAIGLRDVTSLLAIVVPTIATMLIALAASFRRFVPFSHQVAIVIATLVGAMATTRIYGPLILTPTLIGTFTIVLMTHPHSRARRVGFISSAIALVLPMLLELTGLLPHSYAFENDVMIVKPQLMALSGIPTSVFLVFASLAMTAVPCLFISNLRKALNEAQIKLLLQGWQLEQLAARSILESNPDLATA
jgi:serine/threonine-protein kinase